VASIKSSVNYTVSKLEKYFTPANLQRGFQPRAFPGAELGHILLVTIPGRKPVFVFIRLNHCVFEQGIKG
jgi:hypothetical protein